MASVWRRSIVVIACASDRVVIAEAYVHGLRLPRFVQVHVKLQLVVDGGRVAVHLSLVEEDVLAEDMLQVITGNETKTFFWIPRLDGASEKVAG